VVCRAADGAGLLEGNAEDDMDMDDFVDPVLVSDWGGRVMNESAAEVWLKSLERIAIRAR
jgi:hypothetical protein